MADPKTSPPQNSTKEASKAKKPANKNLSKQKPLPLLIETAFTVAKIAVIVFGVVILLVSVSSDNSLITAAIHSIVAMVVTGVIAWLIVWMLVRGSMDSLIAEIKNAKETKPESTKDFIA